MAACGVNHRSSRTTRDSGENSRRGTYHQHDKSQAVLLSHVFTDSSKHIIVFF